MIERLRTGDFDRLADATWELTQVTCEDLLGVAPIGSSVKGELHIDEFELPGRRIGNICVEPLAVIADDEIQLLRKMPRDLSLTISDKDVYRGREDLTLYTQKTLELNTVKRTRQFYSRTQVFDTNGRVIEVLPSRADARNMLASERRKWSTTVTDLLLPFGRVEADYFISVAAFALESLSKNK